MGTEFFWVENFSNQIQEIDFPNPLLHFVACFLLNLPDFETPPNHEQRPY